jgi:hypothetical protein
MDWSGGADSSSVRVTVQDQLDAFHEGPFNGADGSDDADEDAAACSIYAAQTFCQGDAKSARWAASRLIDSTYTQARTARVGLPRSTVEEFAHPLSQRDANIIVTALEILESQRWTLAIVSKLRESLGQDSL